MPSIVIKNDLDQPIQIGAGSTTEALSKEIVAGTSQEAELPIGIIYLPNSSKTYLPYPDTGTLQDSKSYFAIYAPDDTNFIELSDNKNAPALYLLKEST